MERRTIPGEAPGSAGREVQALLDRLRAEDAEFKALSRVMFARSPHEIPVDHPLPDAMRPALSRPRAPQAPLIGMSFWTDAAVLSEAGIPSILYGPTGGGLHSIEEWSRCSQC